MPVQAALMPEITEAMAKGFTLFMVKAIINGKASPKEELAKTNFLR
jgi:pyruvate dehydrogenase (quinone)